MVGRRRLSVAPLTQSGFAPFGQVIETRNRQPLSINEGTTERFHDLANVDVLAGKGLPLISIFRGQPRSHPIHIRMMERHPLGSQAFIPKGDGAYLVVVAPPSANLNVDALSAFLAQGDQGVNYNRGVWHHPLLALSDDQEFIVIDRGGSGDNLQEIWFEDGATAVIDYP